MKKAIVNGRVIKQDGILENGVILIENEHILAVGKAEEIDLSGAAQIDADGAIVGPGFVDIHCHAGGKVWTHEDPVSVAKHHLLGGTTSLCCTLYHNIGIEGALSGGEKIKAAMEEETPGNIAGIHFEGPYLNPKYGADAKKARVPDPAEYEEYIRRFAPIIRQWTFSPEVEGTDEFLKAALSAGIPMAIGHSEASPERVLEVAEKGVTICTHLTNATGASVCPTKYEGTKEVTFDEAAMMAGLMCEVINDSKGAHVRPMMIKFIRSAIGIDRMIGVTDACAAEDDDSDINIVNGEIFGSKLKMIHVARNFKRNTDFSIVDIFKICSTNPAKAVRLYEVGEIAPGKRADFVFVNDDMKLLRVILRGKVVLN